MIPIQLKKIVFSTYFLNCIELNGPKLYNYFECYSTETGCRKPIYVSYYSDIYGLEMEKKYSNLISLINNKYQIISIWTKNLGNLIQLKYFFEKSSDLRLKHIFYRFIKIENKHLLRKYLLSR